MLAKIGITFLACTSLVFAHKSKWSMHAKYARGHDHNKGTQLKHEQIEVPECPEGYIRKGGYCVRPEPVPKELVCPEGSLDDGSQCMVIADGTPDCEQGVYVGNLFCEISESADGRHECPQGSRREEDGCFVGGLISYCPTGSAAMFDNRCQKSYPKEYFCTSGLKDIGSLCVETQYAPVQQTCPEDTLLVDGKCIVEVERQKICPNGFADEGKDCAVYESHIRDQCQPGYTFDAGELICKAVEKFPSTPECLEGAILVNGKCESLVVGPTVDVCKDGVLIDGLCRVTANLPVQYECPVGYVLEQTAKGPVCTTVIKYDCATKSWKCKDEPFAIAKPAHQKHAAPMKAYSPSWGKFAKSFGNFNSYKFRKLHGNAKGGHSGHDHQHHEGYCEKEEVVVPKECEKTMVAEPTPYCTEGEFAGSYCIVHSVYEPSKECVGIEKDGQCVLIESYNPFYVCPDATSPIGDGTYCERVSLEAPTERCPEGTVEFQGSCAIFADKICPAEGCSQVLTWIPEDTCPEEFVLVRAGESKSAGYGHGGHGKWQKTAYYHNIPISKKCIKQTYYPKQSTCPAESFPLDETTCAAYVPLISVDDQEVVQPEFLCPIGYASTPKGCVQTGYDLSDVICPAGYTHIMDTEICSRVVPHEGECPKGSRDINGECFIEVQVNELYIPKQVLKVKIDKKTTPTKFVTTSKRGGGKRFWK